VEAVAPDLLVIGPMYRLQGDDPMDEQVAKAASRVLDHLRLDGAGCALIMEAHRDVRESLQSMLAKRDRRR
jgi:replicative DNA helicase